MSAGFLCIGEILKKQVFDMELLVIGLFAALLIGCIVFGISILWALAAGYVIFFLYARFLGNRVREVLAMSLSGILTIKNVLLTLVLVGMLTALWRAAGTIPAIVCYTVGFIKPSVFLLMAFLLNSLVSFLTGTSFGTGATMGVVCMTMAHAMGVSPVLAGGAALSGAFFGDRCSMVSSSALLVAELTSTDIFGNVGKMLRTGAVPFVLSCLVYGVMGLLGNAGAAEALQVKELFEQGFRLGWAPLLPAVIILVLSLFRIPVKRAMLVSILAAVVLCAFYQKMEAAAIVRTMVLGYRCGDGRLAEMMNGGGISSMVRVVAIVCLSSSYEGIFEKTGLLVRLKGRVEALEARTTRFFAVFVTSVAACMIACNQTLAIMLTHQICGREGEDKQAFAIDLENSVIVIAPLVPWSIAGAAPLSSMSAPMLSLAAACYLYLIPAWQLVVQRTRG